MLVSTFAKLPDQAPGLDVEAPDRFFPGEGEGSEAVRKLFSALRSEAHSAAQSRILGLFSKFHWNWHHRVSLQIPFKNLRKFFFGKSGPNSIKIYYIVVD